MTLLNIKLSNGTKRLVKYKAPTKGTVVIGGRTYPTVKIGSQRWMAENLDWKFDVNGSQIPIGYPYPSYYTTPAAWYYNDDENTYGVNGNKYGLLYNWYAVEYLDNTYVPNLDGWRLPTSTDYQSLIDNYTISQLKSETGWDTDNGNNESGFNAYPSGYRGGVAFAQLGTHFLSWTSTEHSSDYAYRLQISQTASVDERRKYDGYSLRLVKDAT